ncbi:hypothetical protein G4Y73_06385 [Wenzhouxiangella sp. XN201]|uniref:hypothetical protein n=1 Tax=Wenzhouxiangella sp. XN201 TaxID=2710755 RepID=UPI0013C6E0AE|nr:hypothetical protein [Wenzhouxiangella sp. XN201]NEZ03776.1 hypothetical protein [Wenzhouxiangella sp. XN201]
MREPEICMTFPQSPGVQAQLAEGIKEAIEKEQSIIVAAWCPETGFIVACHVAEGRPCYWESAGPITERQADQFAESLKDSNARCRVLM